MYGISVLFSSRVVRIHSRYFSSGSSKKLLEILGNMPKTNTARIAEAQRQRQKISKKSEKYGPSTVYLQVLGSGAKGAPNTLYLFTDQKRYLFNCGECTQRLAHEHKVKLSKLDHIFITNKTWKNIGGLPGLSLTLQDVGVPNITLHGPEGLDELYNATKRFVIMKDMNVTMAKCSPNEDFEDSVMSVKYVLLGQLDDLLNLKQPVKKVKGDGASSDKEYEEFIHDDIDYYKSDKGKAIKEKPKVKVKTSVEKDPLKKKTEKVLQELQRKSNCSVAYICTLKKRLGTLDLAKCVERGVKPGPMLGQLKNGHNVVLPDGSFVLSKDVKTPDDPGPVFIVLDVPDASYLKESDFQAHFDNAGNPPENIPVLIVHFTPLHVFHDPAYRAFMAMFGPCTRHLVLNSQNTCLGSEAVHRTQHKLHLLDPDIFPLLRDVSVPAVWNAQPPVPKTNSPIRLKGLEELKNKIALAQFQNIINLEGACKGDGQIILDDADFVKPEVLVGRTLTMFHLRPRRQLDRSAEPKLHIQEYIQETMDVDGFVGSLQQFRRLVDGIRYAKSDTKEYPKVVFLGTGSCIPSKTRNTSAIVVRIDEDHSMLLDCGEGTFGQLVRFYGPKKVNAFLRTLKAIYISHLHADHHIGLIGVLQARAQAFQELPDQPQIPLYLMAPGQIVAWLNIYDQQFERIKSEFTLVPNQSLLQDTCVPNPDLTGAALAALGIQDLRTCLVAHCPNAFGVAIQINQQYKLTYSGDTLPCEELVRIGYNSTLLIHEATMEDELVDEARTKMHSTTTQAIEIGRQMNAQYTVLTHFSQRYARLPRLNANILNDNRSVGIAFDNMQITMSDLELLPHMYAPLQLMFAEHCVEMELKAAQRARAREARPMRSHEAPVTTSQPAPPAALTPKRSRDHSKEPARQPEVPVETRRCTENTKRPSVPCTRASATANYRESNASRLRQEVKGMMVTGIVGKPMHPCSRSSSCSPSKTPQRSPTRTPLPNDDSKRPSKEADPEQCPDIASTVSLTSYLGRDSGSKINRCDCETTGYVVDAGISSRSAPSSENFYASAYGKPLVTAMNKKLVIRREMVPIGQHYSRTGLKERVSYAERARSPSLPRGSRNQTPPTPRSVSPRSHIKLPTNPTVSSNKLQSSYASSEASPDTKIPVSKTNFGSRHLRHPVVYVNKCNKYPARDSSPENRPADSKTKLKLPRHRQRETKTSRPETPLGTPPMSPTRGRSPASATVPPAMMHSGIRSFKPQLEDIKSSFLLLNKKTQDKDNKLKSCADHVKNKPYSPVSKPSPVNESLRKQQLLEAKKKFQSKQFWCDSKYDKIEGLNWISWR